MKPAEIKKQIRIALGKMVSTRYGMYPANYVRICILCKHEDGTQYLAAVGEFSKDYIFTPSGNLPAHVTKFFKEIENPDEIEFEPVFH